MLTDAVTKVALVLFIMSHELRSALDKAIVNKSLSTATTTYFCILFETTIPTTGFILYTSHLLLNSYPVLFLQGLWIMSTRL